MTCRHRHASHSCLVRISGFLHFLLTLPVFEYHTRREINACLCRFDLTEGVSSSGMFWANRVERDGRKTRQRREGERATNEKKTSRQLI